MPMCPVLWPQVALATEHLRVAGLDREELHDAKYTDLEDSAIKRM